MSILISVFDLFTPASQHLKSKLPELVRSYSGEALNDCDLFKVVM